MRRATGSFTPHCVLLAGGRSGAAVRVRSDSFTWSKQDVVRPPEGGHPGLTCVVQRARSRRIACCLRAGGLALLFVSTLALRSASASESFGTRLGWPLAGSARPLRGGFGEPRAGHFHAGLDVSTGGRTGAPVD